jgi:iron complex transport system substrate-binding protein
MPASALALAASAAVRAASLNLCTDEYLLLLAEPEQVVSVSHLSHSPLESALWQSARRAPANSGSLESVLRFRPTLVFTMGGGGRDSAALARRLGIRLVQLSFPSSVAEVERQAAHVAAALGTAARVRPFAAKLGRLRRSAPSPHDAAFLSGGGLSLSPDALGAEWMRLAGYRQRPLPNGRLTLETMATNPPKWLIRSDYRRGQYDRGQAWLRHPLVRRLSARTIGTDGRAWTCAGLPMIAEVERLRLAAR